MATAEPIAIVGSGCRFPGGVSSPSGLWSLLKNPRHVGSKVPSDRFNIDAFYNTNSGHHGTTNVQESYFLDDDIHRFDAPFFNISAREAEGIDPQQRILLETVYEAVERAGMRPTTLQGSSTGVFCGVMCDDYAQILARDTDQLPQYASTGIARNNVSNRISYFFDWHGPSMTIDTACSSSLVAVHLAVQAIREGSCSVAVACGTNLILSPIFYMSASRLNMLSPTGRSRMWDASADGYARGEGVASVVLKRLSDAIADGDVIECVIRETNVNQDGRTMGITMPSSVAQAQLIRSTYSKAGLRLDRAEDRCQYFEAHGTGTQAGDPQEAGAIAEAFFPAESGDDTGELLVGSVKTVIGHTEGTAGLAGLLKASLCIQHGVIVPNLHFNTLSPKVEPFYSHLRIPTTVQPWPQLPPGVPRRASVNSFGFGGTNAHVILENYKPPPVYLNGTRAVPTVPMPLPFVFSASSDRTLGAVLESYSKYLDSEAPTDHISLSESLCTRRDDLAHKVVLTVSSVDGLRAALTLELERRGSGNSSAIVRRPGGGAARKLGIFTGQGAQWPRMGHDLISASPAARAWIDELQRSLDELPPQYRPRYSLMQELAAPSEDSRLGQAAVSQPLCTAVQIVLVRLLDAVGVTFDAVVGHSSGEIAAAYAAGLVSAADAIRIAHLRGMFAKLAGANSNPGAMMAAGLSEVEAAELCGEDRFRGRVAVAAVNSPLSVTLSGDADGIAEVAEVLSGQGKFARILKVDTAYHSHHMVPCSNAYIAALKEVGIQSGGRPSATWFSSVYPGQVMDDSCTAPLRDVYWNDNMLKSVLFSQSVTAAITSASFDIMIEVGPHPTLKGPVMQTISEIPGASTDVPYLGLLRRGIGGLDTFAAALGSLWTHMGPESCKLASYTRLFCTPRDTSPLKSMPTYPFDHTQAYSAESRLSKAIAHRKTIPNQLLGTQSAEAADGEWRWRNYLRREEIEWLDGHQIESQTVFPATGYVAMALEAASVISGGKPIRLIDICDFHVAHAISFDENSSGVETLFKLEGVDIQGEASRMSASFSCHAAFGATLRRCAYGKMDITFGDQEPSLLPGRGSPPQGLNSIGVDDFYSYLGDVGYGYTDLFRGITAIGRKKDVASGRMMNASLHDTASSLVMHPATMDTLLQTILGAIGAPHDGRLYTLCVPTMITRITVNPLFGGRAGMGEEIAFDARLTDYGPGAIAGDAALFDVDGNCVLQMEGVKVSPLSTPTAADDRLLFSETVWGPLHPDASLHYTEPSPELCAAAELKEKVVLLYMKQIRETLTEDDVAVLDWHGKRIVSWFDHVLGMTRAGRHPTCKPGWLDSTISEVVGKLDVSTVDMEAVRVIGESMVPFLRGGTTILEVLRERNILNRLYKEFTDTTIVGQMAAVADQLAFRYPRMKILEIGAGTGSATGAILDRIGRAYYSYTYTDISPGFFDDAQQLFEDHSDRFIYKILDIEKNPVDQGFDEHSYDLIVAANVLHATRSLQETLIRARSLLKPGGSLLLLEGTNIDVLLGSFIFSGFESWWLGEAEGRVWGPMVTGDTWDKMLKTAGFSGVDTITPDHDKGLRPFSVVLSQAVDDEVQLLRDPFTPGRAVSHRGNLYIVGGATPWTSILVTKLGAILSPFFERIIKSPTLESRELLNLAPMSTVLNLTDLDGPCFKDINEAQFDALKTLLDTSHNLLWVTTGPESDNPYDGMSKGLLACAGYENPHSRYQHLNLVDVDPDAVDAHFVAAQLLRMEAAADSDNDYDLPSRVWTTEPELRLEGGRLWISRIKNDPSMNMRYMSGRRSIEEEIDLGESSMAISESGELVRAARQAPWESTPAGVSIRVRYSTSVPFRFDGAGLLYLVIGAGQGKMQGRFLALSESQESVISTPPVWCWPVPKQATGENEAAYLYGAACALLAANLVNMASPKTAMLVHEADHTLRSAISVFASAAGIKPLFTTSKTQQALQKSTNMIFVHEMSSARALADLLPVANVSVAVRFDTGPSKPCGGIWSRLDALLPPHVRRESLQSLHCHTSAVHASCGVTRTTASLEGARCQALRSSIEGLTAANIVDVQALVGSDGLRIVDWTGTQKVRVPVQPASNLVSLSPNKTYLLVGMTGDLGRSVCQWMIGRGARHVVLTSRKPKVEGWWIEEMARLGGQVTAMPM